METYALKQSFYQPEFQRAIFAGVIWVITISSQRIN